MKLCECKIKRLKSNTNLVYWAGRGSKKASFESTERHALEMEKMIDEILEEPCTCQENPTMADSLQLPTVTIDHQKGEVSSTGRVNVVIISKWYSLKEKQSQSPCEHEWEQMFWKEFIPQTMVDGASLYKTHLLPMWGCISKCGLVTCKNPNN